MNEFDKSKELFEYYGDDINDSVRMVNQAQNNENARNKSVQRGATNKKNKKRKKSKKEFIAGALAAVMLISGIKIVGEINDRIKASAERQEAVAAAVEIMENDFDEAGFGTFNENGYFVIGDNDCNDYAKVINNVANDALLYTAYEVIVDDNDPIRTNDEFRDFLGGVSYDGEHNFDDNMYTVMGYVDKDGKSSVAEFKAAGQKAIVEAYRNGTLENVLGSNNGRSK